MHILLDDQDISRRDEILRYLRDRFGSIEVVAPEALAPEHGHPDLILAPGPVGAVTEPDTVASGPGEPDAAGAVLDAMSVPAGYVDADLTIHYCNPAAAQLLGRSVEEVRGRSLRDLVPHYPAVWRAVEGVLKRGEPYTHTVWGTLPGASDPVERGYRVTYRPHRNSGGRVIGCLVEAEDVTYHATVVAELEQNAARMRASLEKLPQGIVICDGQGRIVRMNARAEQLLGDRVVTRGTALSVHLQEMDAQWADGTPVTTPDALPHVRALQGETVSGEILSWRVDRFAERHWYALSAAPVTDRDGTITAAVTSFTDLPGPLYPESVASRLEPEAVEVEELTIELEAQNIALQESAASLGIERQQIQAVLSALPVDVWIADRNGRLIQKNREADRVWSGDAPLVDSIQEYARYAAWDAETGEVLSSEDYPVAKALRTGERVESVELRIQRQDGTEGVILVSAAPVKDREGRLIGVVGVNVDITARKRAEEALRRYAVELEQANGAVRVLLQEVNHRVKNNLTAILGLILAEQRRLETTACRDTGGAGEETGASAPTQAALDNLAERVRSLATVHTLLSAAGWRPLPVDELVNAVVRAAVPALAEPESVALEITGASPEITPEQAHHLALVISELTTNVLKHGGTKEEICISVDIGLEKGDVRLVFRNRGPDYSKAVLAGEGRSVGLNIVEKLVTHSLRGTWEVHNNGGPVTEIRFPFDPQLNRRTAREFPS